MTDDFSAQRFLLKLSVMNHFILIVTILLHIYNSPPSQSTRFMLYFIYMKRLFFISFCISMVGFFAFAGTPVFAQSTFDQTELNFLISDEELQDAESMTRREIQAFLVNQGSLLARVRTRDYRGRVLSATDIIYNAARRHQINPKYILVLLQKEQSLITAQRPTRKQFDWATGYGVCDTCYFNSPALQAVKGFGKQVEKSAAILRWYYERVGQYGWIKQPGKSYFIDGLRITPANHATAFLYTYTPHIQGNANFLRLYYAWFKERYAEGTLVRDTDTQTIYQIRKGKKHPYANELVLSLYETEPEIIPATADILMQYEEGSLINFPPFSLLFDTDTKRYYLVDYDRLRPIPNERSFRSFGYHPDELIHVQKRDIAHMKIGPTLQR